jgi:6-pyruvoyltetrahydropterin/6-carboxytetrahydropterin synthase
MDYADIKAAFAPCLALLDHNYLNDIPSLDNPTSEVIARWIALEMLSLLPNLSRVEVFETCTSGAIFRC